MATGRISARRGQVANLDAMFYRNGVLTDPFAVRKVEIYQTSIEPSNLVATIPFVDPSDSLYPAPAVSTGVGKMYLPYEVPTSVEVPNIFFDLWYYYADNPCGSSETSGTEETVGCDLDDPDLEASLLKCCHRFWAYPDGWACVDDLTSLSFGFEPLSIHFNKPEVRPLEIGLMPLPLYDYDYNLYAPLIPYLSATISVETRSAELLIDDEEMTIALRQGSYRSNPFVLRWQLNTSRFLIGTYRYKVTITLPDGSTRTSRWMIFDVA